MGKSITVSCHYSTNSTLHSVAYFRRKHLLCYYIFQNKSWIKISRENHIKFIWIQETEEIVFELLNLQISHSGIYTLTVEEHAPPPARRVREERIFIHVISKRDYILFIYFFYRKILLVILDLVDEYPYNIDVRAKFS